MTELIITKPEAEALEARLTRIWQPLESHYRYSPGVFPGFDYEANLADGIVLRVDNGDGELNFDLVRGNVLLMAKPSLGVIDVSDIYQTESDREEFALFRAEYLLFFRRNCWLSGCDVEATAREKAEWMQDFNQEEIEEWNLKI